MKGRQLFMTRVLARPMALLRQRVSSVISGTESPLDARFMLSSAHDAQLAHFMTFMAPLDWEDWTIPFAGNTVFEARADRECLENNKGDQCIIVKLRHNGKEFGLEGCKDPKSCTYAEFDKIMAEKMYQGDMDEACESWLDWIL